MARVWIPEGQIYFGYWGYSSLVWNYAVASSACNGLQELIFTRLPCYAACQAKLAEDLAARNTIRTTLDPLLLALSRDYVDDKDLTSRLQKLFKASPPT